MLPLVDIDQAVESLTSSSVAPGLDHGLVDDGLVSLNVGGYATQRPNTGV